MEKEQPNELTAFDKFMAECAFFRDPYSDNNYYFHIECVRPDVMEEFGG